MTAPWRQWRTIASLALLSLTLASGVGQAAQAVTPDHVRELIAERAAHHGASAAELLRVASCETGQRFIPLVGGAGERGVFQWLPGGAWRLTSHARAGVDIVALYRAGDPEAIWLDIDGAAELYAPSYRQRTGYDARREWSCWR